MRSKHADSYPCTLCEAKFATSEARKDHVKADHIEAKKKHECPSCGKVYYKLELYKIHMESVHRGLKDYL